MTKQKDWTMKRGRSNTSDAFVQAVETVARLLRDHRVGGDVVNTARLIVAQLAHIHGLAPIGASQERPEDDTR